MYSGIVLKFIELVQYRDEIKRKLFLVLNVKTNNNVVVISGIGKDCKSSNLLHASSSVTLNKAKLNHVKVYFKVIIWSIPRFVLFWFHDHVLKRCSMYCCDIIKRHPSRSIDMCSGDFCHSRAVVSRLLMHCFNFYHYFSIKFWRSCSLVLASFQRHSLNLSLVYLFHILRNKVRYGGHVPDRVFSASLSVLLEAGFPSV